MSTNLVAFIVVLGVLIFFHELGHFLVARFFGVGVERFSLGFGPRIFGKKVGITDYRISAIPLGGYVKMVGEEPDTEIDPADIPISFTHKHVFKRILIVAAGPFFNLLLAAVIFYGVFQISGLMILKPVVGAVEADTPAALAGLAENDRIDAIGGTPIGSWEEMAAAISKSEGNPLVLTVARGDSLREVVITPVLKPAETIFGEPIDRFVIGISAAGDFETQRLNPFQALYESVHRTYYFTKLTVVSVVKLIQGTVSTKTLGGPIMIAEMAGQQAKEGAWNLVTFIALLSINLAILNILPIPVLDGGHLLFLRSKPSPADRSTPRRARSPSRRGYSCSCC